MFVIYLIDPLSSEELPGLGTNSQIDHSKRRDWKVRRRKTT